MDNPAGDDIARRVDQPWCAKVITLFPEAFPGTLGLSLVGKALTEGLWRLETLDLREFGIGRHRAVDDSPFGGGPGMILRADVAAAAIECARSDQDSKRGSWPVMCMSARGQPATQALARKLSSGPGVTVLCGRFEGVDERIFDKLDVQEISMGDFVLSGGEIAAQALIDATVRLIPRVLGNQASVADESFSDGLLEYPQYTRPRNWEGTPVPDVLLSGNHEEITAWRLRASEGLTKNRRPDLWRIRRRSSE